jgi:tRNA-modifying protein YgfZ
VTWRPARGEAYERYELVPRDQLAAYADAAGPAAGLWAFEALRIARGEPRFGVDTDARTIPNEVGWIGSAVHMDKGCYRGQETVARVHTLGRPPRRLTLLHLDGSENRLPPVGADLLLGEKSVGFVGSSARHHELGPIALALVKRNVDLGAELEMAVLVAKGQPLSSSRRATTRAECVRRRAWAARARARRRTARGRPAGR